MLNSLKKDRQVPNGLVAIIIFSIIVFFFSIVATNANKLSFSKGFSFLFFLIFLCFLPGVAILTVIKPQGINTISFIGISCLIGYCVNILEYFILFPLGLKNFSIFLACIIAILSIIVIVKNNFFFHRLESHHLSEITIFLIFLIYVFSAFYAFNMINISPSLIEANTFYNDNLYWINNTNALLKGFPPIDPRTSGFEYNYHYFSSIWIAFMAKVLEFSHVDIFSLSFAYSYIFPAVLLTTSAYSVTKKITSRNSLSVLAPFVILLTTGLDRFTIMTYAHHLIPASFGFDYSLAILLFFLYLVIIIFEKHAFSLKYAFLLTILSFILTGTKGTTGALAIAFLGIVSTHWLIKKQYRNAFFYGLPCFLIFVVTYKYLVAFPLEIGRFFIPFERLIVDNIYFSTFYKVLISAHIPATVSKLLIAFVWVIYSQPLIFTTFFISVALAAVNYKKISIISIGLVGTTFFGIAITLSIKLSGMSEMYFMLGAFPIALLASLSVLSNCFNFSNNLSKNMKIILSSSLVIALSLGVFENYYVVYPKMLEGRQKYNLSRGFYNEESQTLISEDKIYNINYSNAEDMKAYNWIRDTISENDVIIFDRSTITHPNINFHIGAFSQKQEYVVSGYIHYEQEEYARRFEIADKVYLENSIAALLQLKDENVNYLAQTKWLTPDFNSDNQFGELLTLEYETETIAVYRIN